MELPTLTMTREGRMFKFAVDKKISQEEAVELQRQQGYPPGGYGFYAFTQCDCKTTWKCGDSCD